MGQLPRSESGAFRYIGRNLVCDAIPLTEIARDFGTPTYVYSRSELLRNATAFTTAARHLDQPCLVCYAVKANGNQALLRILAELGLGADIVSGGELFLALNSGFEPKNIVFSGVGKTPQEISEAISAGVLGLHVESSGEQQLISRVAESLGKIAPVAVRVNPDIAVDTHAHIATGAKNHKFGVAPDLAMSLMRAAQGDPWLYPVGLSAHLGSQIASLEPFSRVGERLGSMADELSDIGLRLDYIDMGGGLAIDYGQGSGPTIGNWLDSASSAIIRRGYRLLVEPGRSIVGPAGALLTRVLYTKAQEDRHLVVTDAGMTDLMRPALYGARHPILPVQWNGSVGSTQSVGATEHSATSEGISYDIVGPVCESADVLARGVALPPVQPGDLLAILQTGAYGFAMSSNYNGRPRPAEVLIAGKAVRCIRYRERYDDLLSVLQ